MLHPAAARALCGFESCHATSLRQALPVCAIKEHAALLPVDLPHSHYRMEQFSPHGGCRISFSAG